MINQLIVKKVMFIIKEGRKHTLFNDLYTNFFEFFKNLNYWDLSLINIELITPYRLDELVLNHDNYNIESKSFQSGLGFKTTITIKFDNTKTSAQLLNFDDLEWELERLGYKPLLGRHEWELFMLLILRISYR